MSYACIYMIANFICCLFLKNYPLFNTQTSESFNFDIFFDINDSLVFTFFNNSERLLPLGLTSSLCILLFWLIYPTINFFTLLIVLELVFATISFDFLIIANFVANSEGFILVFLIIIFAALESVIGLSFLITQKHYTTLDTLNSFIH